jgi:hypothetical protein
MEYDKCHRRGKGETNLECTGLLLLLGHLWIRAHEQDLYEWVNRAGRDCEKVILENSEHLSKGKGIKMVK